MRLLLFSLGLLVAVVRSEDNPLCPAPPTGLAGICVFTDENCLQDSECLNGQICCRHLCGKICKDKVSLTISKPGTCPSNAALSCYVGNIVNSCSADSDCQGDQKCCDLCGKTCTAPEGSGPILLPIEPVCRAVCAIYCPYGNVPDENGCPTCICKETPCKGEAPLTLDSNGNSLYCGLGGDNCPPDSECITHPADAYAVCCPKEPVVSPPVCPIYDCLPTQYCEFGYRTDSNGCTTCECKKTPCEGEAPLTVNPSTGNSINCGRGGERCPSDSECKIHPADRYAVCCPKGPIVLPPLPVVKSGSCPVPPSQFLLRCASIDRCKYDSVCEGTQKCCDHPCGRQCRDIVKTKPGVCPKPADPATVLCKRRGDDCYEDASCPGSQKCCQGACGNACMDTLLTATDHEGTCPALDPKIQALIFCAYLSPECELDSDCNIDEKCCNDYCGIRCVKSQPKVTIKSGNCPVPPSSLLVKCASIDRCKDDSACEGTQKCCDHPCGSQCQDIAKPKAGSCRRYRYRCRRQQRDFCSTDDDCRGARKCCKLPCGNRCRLPQRSRPTLPVPSPNTNKECPAIKTNPFFKIFCAAPLDLPCTIDADCSKGEMCCPGKCFNRCLKSPTAPACDPNPCGDAQIKCQYGQAKDANGCALCKCNQCPDGVPISNCFADPCQMTKCNNPAAVRCGSNYCGGCNAVFYDKNGYEVDCSAAVKGK